MHIKSVILEGFKSYAQRTEVNGFDPLFNAITGLNGSGKSNILDSICFLLGISNLSQVRASNLQDLVYKNGQAGITKALVSITFDNSDKKQSPLGFEVHDEITVTRQVVIGGRNKYLINGVNANNTRVYDLFCSVGLNVNNPHFLIMQGRITKVMNMKPPEILSMIEEAAGTRMYEYKKQNAQRTIEKKEAKLREIKTILEEEITPTIQKLKEERSSYLEYQKLLREIEHLSRLYIAYQFLLAEDTKERSAEALKEMQDKIKKLQEEVSENDKKIKALSHEIEELEKRKDKEVGGILRSLEDALTEAQRVNTKSQSAFDFKKKNLASEENKRKELEKNMVEDSKTLAAKEKEVKKITDGLSALQEASNKDAEALAVAQQHFNAVSAGLSSNEDGAEATLAGQMMACKNEISKTQTEAKQAQMKLKHAQQELKTKQTEIKKMDSGYRKDQEALEAVKKLKEKLETEMKRLNYEENKEESLLERRRQLSRDISRLKETEEALLARFPNLRFAYRDPEKNWNRNCVKGLVASLISVKNSSATTALELVAGDRLYNVVVDTEVTGKKLLEKGELKRRYTIIPLNKISSRCIAPETLRIAQNLVGPNNVHVALSLVEYKPELQKAMEFVFGMTFVCDNMDNAKKVAFDKRIMTRTVTLGGDVFDPHGTLSGGARSQAASILMKFQELKDVQDELRTKENELRALEEELANLKNTAEKYRHLKQQWEMKAEEVDLLQTKLQQSSYHKQQEELDALKKIIEESEETLKNTKEIQKKAEEKYEVLENKMKNAEAERERELKDAQKKLDCAKTKADASSKKMKEKQQEVEAITLELEELRREHASYEQQLEAVKEAIISYEGQIAVMASEVAKNEELVNKAQEEVSKQKEVITAQDNIIKAKYAEIAQHKEQNNESQLKIKELDHNISKHKREAEDAAAKVSKMLKDYDWITVEKHLFGQPNSTYDFKANNPKEAGERLQKLQEMKEKLGRNVNMRAMNVLTEAEERYNDLMKKKRIVENDKSKILATIEDLDQKKNQAINIAWQKVNKDFGSIFSTLLPGANAMLAPPEGQTVLDGLEFKVALGNTWKENLTELSGGQRSLVALSLILSMLLFKPAPIYILDEVDAALDLSHTQNIGHMLRTHFTHSQFIVVSLKEGMFNNANVLFKTKFVDGVSTVARFTQCQNGKVPKENESKSKRPK
ncbi:PREDICTED: structural maintenance of chromosomes protein 2 [Bison bison bison]|uniref:Structural maintenance of chromosomes protein n=1 Tax=Bison bison bison TaxID=43346 RepID=A0A6P3HHQ5_BISBB|nr:PREDICTED: structural maintenance of chromosomes protein 2 [Bison bison bison]XP_010841825.1 PREDICTED: structural maintenance of chromosomes protein 2 [Bison bison bison]XP_010841826.1 PREDICTED: structural maintenance of chromosomes protein 2 [Bison bison bison]XP_010841827.1 PREDICTED: structural maintenance of chromosomes protein 2 [Bison bison bison]